MNKLNEPSNKVNWPLRTLLFIVLMYLSTIISMVFNAPSEVDATIKSRVSQLIGIENVGHVQSVQTRYIGPITFFKFNYFPVENYQVSAKATQFLAFNPQITCVSGSKNYRCQ